MSLEILMPAKSQRIAKKDKPQSKRGRTANGTAKSASSKVRLLEAAIELFAASGFEGVSTGDVASRAGYSQAIIHYHFGSKDELWREAMTHLLRDLDARFPLDVKELSDLQPLDRLKVVVRRFIALSAHSTALTSILARETLSDGERLKWLVSRHFQKRIDFLEKIVAELMRTGEANKVPSYVATQVILLSSSFFFCMAPLIKQVHGIDPAAGAEFDRLPDDLLTLFLQGLLKR
jgi:TetR/AcrR family transcriptional regulator